MGEGADPELGGYRLDQLGWLEFERLADEVLARNASVAEARWFGRADEGRVAVTAGDVVVPEVGRVAGPSLVIVAAWSALVIPQRLQVTMRDAARDAGVVPRSALVVTNGPHGDVQAAIWHEVLRGIPRRRRVRLGPKELSAALEADPALRCRVPSVLAVRDLAGPAEGAVVARSTGDLGAARRLARVFVGTRAYARTLAVVERHHFAVVTGPPEMGKTAIARIIALAKLTEGWEAHECSRPEELWPLFARDRSQVFIADDAFGSTEYRPEAAERWALELDHVLRVMDGRHWLIWTSRPAPLKAGLARIHREHGVERFPQPAEVRVDASDLNLEEKASILFRHARSRPLTARGVELVQTHGWGIVDHPHFTPERIRRFVAHRLPDLEGADAPVGRADVGEAVTAEIREPTEAMERSLLALSPEYRGLLIALLDAPPGPAPERDVATAARRHLDAGLQRRPADLVDRLADHFLRLVPPQSVTWVHPSWRDLVIDHVAGDATARARFLERSSLDGLLLALSVGGGATGARRFPLLVTDSDWDTATDRLSALIPHLEDSQLMRLLASLEAAVLAPSDARVRSEARALAKRCLELARKQLNARGAAIPVAVLESWHALAAGLGADGPGPDMAPTWIELAPTASSGASTVADLVGIEEWLRLVLVLANHDPDALSRFGFPGGSRELLMRLADEARRAAPAEERRTDRADVLVRIARLLVRIGVCHDMLLPPAAQQVIEPVESSGALPDLRQAEDDRDLVARILGDLVPSV